MNFPLVLILILSACFGAHSQTTGQAKKQPPPKIVYRHAKSRHKQLKAEVFNKVISPLLCECKTPIEEIIVDFCPEILGMKEGERGCQNEDKGELTISVTVNRWDGASSVVWIERGRGGGIGQYEYLRIFEGDDRGCIPNKGCASEGKRERKL
jgi:hypothetical protein